MSTRLIHRSYTLAGMGRVVVTSSLEEPTPTAEHISPCAPAARILVSFISHIELNRPSEVTFLVFLAFPSEGFAEVIFTCGARGGCVLWLQVATNRAQVETPQTTRTVQHDEVTPRHSPSLSGRRSSLSPSLAREAAQKAIRAAESSPLPDEV